MNKKLLILTVFCVVILTCSAIISTIPNTTLTNAQSTLIKTLKAGKSASLKDLHYTLVSLLKVPVNKDESKKAIDEVKGGLCSGSLLSLTEESVASLSLNDLYNAIAAISALKCDVSEGVATAVESRLTTLVETVSDYEGAYDAVRSIFLFRRNLKSLASNKEALEKVFNTIKNKFNEERSAFCTGKDGDDVCALQTGLAFETLSLLHNLLGNTKLQALVAVGKNVAPLVQSIGSKVSLRSASAFARGVTKLGTIVPLEKKIDANDFNSLTSYFIDAASKPLTTVSDIYNFVEGATSIASSAISTPVYVSQITRDAESPVFTVVVSNLFGQSVSDKEVKVTVTSVYKGSDAKDSLLLKPATFTKKSETEFSWDATRTKIFDNASAFNFDIEVSPVGKKVTRSFKSFAGDLSIEELSISGSKGVTQQTIKYGEKLSVVRVPVNAQSRVLVSFKLNGSLTPQQAFIRLAGEDQEAVYVAKASGQSYKVDINLQKVGKEVSFTNGTYDLQIIVGDSALKQPIQWTAGQFQLSFQDAPAKNEEALLYAPRPEITHVFAEPAKRAGESIATIFTGLIGLPLAVLFIGILRVGINFDLVPSGLGAPLSLVFIGLIAAMLFVLARFFIDVTIFPTMWQLSVLAVGATLVGQRVLVGINQKRTQSSN